jgi:hypothetical protein
VENISFGITTSSLTQHADAVRDALKNAEVQKPQVKLIKKKRPRRGAPRPKSPSAAHSAQGRLRAMSPLGFTDEELDSLTALASALPPAGRSAA